LRVGAEWDFFIRRKRPHDLAGLADFFVVHHAAGAVFAGLGVELRAADDLEVLADAGGVLQTGDVNRLSASWTAVVTLENPLITAPELPSPFESQNKFRYRGQPFEIGSRSFQFLEAQ
jgi:hypothetical protein